jgi:hypothetical protein
VTYLKNFRIPFFNLECKGKGTDLNSKELVKVFFYYFKQFALPIKQELFLVYSNQHAPSITFSP